MAQTTEPAVETHMKDFEGHLRALESDIEYWRAKRLLGRILHYVRRDILPLHVMFETAAASSSRDGEAAEAVGDHDHAHDGDEHGHVHAPMEQRIRKIEDRLDEYVRAIAMADANPGAVDVVVDDTRKERGTYDPFFRPTKRAHGGTLEHRIDQLERELDQNMLVVETFTRSLIAHGLLSEETLAQRRVKQANRQKEGEQNGARIVAHAWVDPGFRQRLIENGREAVRELDIPPGRLAKLAVAENTASVHNVVVCTLCSCYPSELLGNPPWWYRSDAYKQQIVQDPRSVLADMFKFQVEEDVVIQVHDSTSDLRWMVLPARPAGTEGWTEEQLAQLVTQDSLVGVSRPQPGARDGA